MFDFLKNAYSCINISSVLIACVVVLVIAVIVILAINGHFSFQNSGHIYSIGGVAAIAIIAFALLYKTGQSPKQASLLMPQSTGGLMQQNQSMENEVSVPSYNYW